MSLVNTLTQSLRLRYPNPLDKNEQRPSQYGVFNAFMADTMSPQTILSPDLRTLVERSAGNTVQVPVIDFKDVTITNTRSCTVSADENTSNLVTLTFVQYVAGFKMYPAQHFNNDISYQADFDRKYEAMIQKLASTIDTACYTKANTQRNQVWNADTLAQYAQVGNALQVNPSQQDVFYNVLPSIMETMDFYGNLNIVANTMHKPYLSFTANQGAGNNTNLGFQFDRYTFNTSNRVTNTSGATSTLFASTMGTYGIWNRNHPDALAGTRTTSGVEWGITRLPILEMDFGYQYSSGCENISSLNSGTTGLTSNAVESFQWATEVCYLTPYNSDPTTRFNPIVKVDFLAEEA